jgi:hypothetical protein
LSVDADSSRSFHSEGAGTLIAGVVADASLRDRRGRRVARAWVCDEVSRRLVDDRLQSVRLRHGGCTLAARSSAAFVAASDDAVAVDAD